MRRHPVDAILHVDLALDHASDDALVAVIQLPPLLRPDLQSRRAPRAATQAHATRQRQSGRPGDAGGEAGEVTRWSDCQLSGAIVS
eukprot:COSAG01_NODE_4744_length_4770_cov_93.028688_5_plen_86_part_00